MNVQAPEDSQEMGGLQDARQAHDAHGFPRLLRDPKSPMAHVSLSISYQYHFEVYLLEVYDVGQATSINYSMYKQRPRFKVESPDTLSHRSSCKTA